jgi:hypothetical protein
VGGIEDLSRLILTIVHAVIVILAVAHYRKRPDTRAYTVLVISLGFVNFVFYALAYTWRVGGIRPSYAGLLLHTQQFALVGDGIGGVDCADRGG